MSIGITVGLHINDLLNLAAVNDSHDHRVIFLNGNLASMAIGSARRDAWSVNSAANDVLEPLLLALCQSSPRLESEPDVPSAIVCTRQIRLCGFEGHLKVQHGPTKKIGISRSVQP